MKFITLTTANNDKGNKSLRINFDLVLCYRAIVGSTPGSHIFFQGDVKGHHPHQVVETVEQIDALLEALDFPNAISSLAQALAFAGDGIEVEGEDDT
jgi:hypothetical protein